MEQMRGAGTVVVVVVQTLRVRMRLVLTQAMAAMENYFLHSPLTEYLVILVVVEAAAQVERQQAMEALAAAAMGQVVTVPSAPAEMEQPTQVVVEEEDQTQILQEMKAVMAALA
jgi:NADH/NAD ratio-sensing transcriptional regulator Rex